MAKKKGKNFLEQIIDGDLASNRIAKDQLRFRFPPEPNGYLHIGHAKAICINFGLGLNYEAPVNLRFDDTNPEKEEQEYVDAIKKDIEWLGFAWDKECYASDYFQQLYDWAVQLIQEKKAYVDEQDSDKINEQRKTPGEKGVESPYRNRPVEESLSLFEKMKNGEVEEGSMVLRAKIDMTSPNMNMRDPVMYRVLKKAHHRTGNAWSIYPIYDWAHGESDYIEQISHSLCSLEFENHRPLYDWYLDQIYVEGTVKNKQREFSRLNLDYTITSKRKLLQLVEEGYVSGWDDPRMPTLSGLRRRGYTPEAIRDFIEVAGVSKREQMVEVSKLEFAVRKDLNTKATRYMAVVHPLRVVIENYPEGEEEWLSIENNPEDENAGERQVPFGKEIYIEQEDFMEEAPANYFRLTLGQEVRLKGAYFIKAIRVEKDSEGNISTVYCTYDPETKSGSGTEASKRKVKGTIHWVSAKQALPIEVRLYDRLFNDETPDKHEDKSFLEFVNPESLQLAQGFAEPALKNAEIEKAVQFQRLGYFVKDKDSTEENLVFNRTVTLKDNWKK